MRKHALDFKVVNPLGLTRSSREGGGARPEPLEAARAYAATARERVAQRCEEAGVRFHPMVLEATGGVEDKEAAPVLHQIAQAVAAVEDRLAAVEGAVQAHGQNTENAPVEETEINYPVRKLIFPPGQASPPALGNQPG